MLLRKEESSLSLERAMGQNKEDREDRERKMATRIIVLPHQFMLDYTH